MIFNNTTPFDIRSFKTSNSPKNSDFKDNGIDRITTIQFGNELDWLHVSSLYHTRHPDEQIKQFGDLRLVIPAPSSIIEKAIPDYLLGEFNKYPSTPKLPYSVFVKLWVDSHDWDEANVGSVEFHSDTSDAKKFKQNVRDAVKEWIETDFDSFLASEADTGRGALDSMDDDDPAKKELALKDGATWDMVYADLPDNIALKHGFASKHYAVNIEINNEYDTI